MTAQPVPACGQHRRPKQWLPTTFEYAEDGISVRVPNVYAWVCPVDGEASFTSDTTDQLIDTVRELLEAAQHAKSRRSVFTEYWVSVG
jgi:hypothetical protein